MNIREKGFNLIELMIAVVIIGVLAALAYPSYLSSVRDARRADAEGAMMSAANFMERAYTESNSYADVTLPIEFSTDYYSISLSEQSSQSFTLQASPTGAQIGDTCGNLTLTHTGVKAADAANCW